MKKLLLFVLAFFVTSPAWAATPAAEIEALLNYVKTLDGAVFIRNGTEHKPAGAESHLRMKWEKQTSKIKTAEDFIRLCATQSSLSGDLYQIRLKDGTTRPAAEVLTQRLKELRQ